MILRFLHGWGFDAAFWEPLAALLREWPAAIDDRGYFGGARTIGDDDQPCVIVAHSFGTMRALQGLPAACRGLVAINGFDRFTAGEDTPGVPLRALDRMIARFADAPEAVLSDFRRRCGSEAPFGAIAPEPLLADLLALRDLDCRAGSGSAGIPILSLQGADDPILPAALRTHVFAAAAHTERGENPAGGHLLPLTHAAYCAGAIRAFAERVA